MISQGHTRRMKQMLSWKSVLLATITCAHHHMQLGFPNTVHLFL